MIFQTKGAFIIFENRVMREIFIINHNVANLNQNMTTANKNGLKYDDICNENKKSFMARPHLCLNMHFVGVICIP